MVIRTIYFFFCDSYYLWIIYSSVRISNFCFVTFLIMFFSFSNVFSWQVIDILFCMCKIYVVNFVCYSSSESCASFSYRGDFLLFFSLNNFLYFFNYETLKKDVCLKNCFDCWRILRNKYNWKEIWEVRWCVILHDQFFEIKTLLFVDNKWGFD